MEKELIKNVNGSSLSILCICAIWQTAKKSRSLQAHKVPGASAFCRGIPFSGAEPAVWKPLRQPHAKGVSDPSYEPSKSCPDLTEPVRKNRRTGWKNAVRQVIPGKEKILKNFFRVCLN
ncbi:hypothetical protein [Caproicibacter sp. BJN0012]|uniref:hypothetical protein n=1 Tax=Caproicibacter sp. BJN0012 TaxID=3110227 RepID=UPI002E0ED756